MSARRIAVGVVILAFALAALRLWIAGTLELSPDEAYYWTWARSPTLAYPDHPPLTAWLVAGGVALAGDTELGVRWPFVLLGTALLPLAFVLGRRTGLRPGTSALVAAAVGTSLLGSAGALLATPETPLVFGWALGLLGLVSVRADRRSALPWVLLAVATAVALLAKLTGVLWPVLVALWLTTPAGRPWRRRPAPYLAVATGIAAAAPAYAADLLGTGGATVFQLSHGLWTAGLGAGARAANVGAFLGGQLALLTPLIAVAVVLYLYRGRRAAEPGGAAVWLSAVVPWAAFGAASVLAPPEPNWPAAAHLGALVGAGWLWERAADRGARWARRTWLAAALGLQLAATLVVHVHLFRPILPLETHSPGPFSGPTDPAARLRGWNALAEALGRRGEPVLPGWYGARAELEFYGGPGWNGHGGVLMPGGRAAPATPEWTVWWVGPAEGLGLPGRRKVEPPGECRPAERGLEGVDGALVRPVAPVRLVRLKCPSWFAKSPPVW